MAKDVTNPDYLLKQDTGTRSAKTRTGRGTFAPGYKLISNKSTGVVGVKTVKQVSPLTGQGPKSNSSRYHMLGSSSIKGVTRLRVQKTVAPNSGSKVIRPKTTPLRTLKGKGQGVVRSI